MKKNQLFLIFSGLALLFATYNYFTKKDDCDRLNSRIQKVIENEQVSTDELNEIIKFCEDHRTKLLACQASLDNPISIEETVKEIIQGKSKKISFEENNLSINGLKVKLFFENSGSMKGYDNEQTHELKETFSSFYNLWEQGQTKEIFIVNDSVRKARMPFTDIVRGNDIYAKINNVGNIYQTNFNLIFKEILKRTDEKTISILFSDLLVSENFSKLKPDGIISDIRAMLMNIFANYADKKSVLLLKYSADFDGTYTDYSNTHEKHNGKRPFYVVVMGKTEILQALLKDNVGQKILATERLQGLHLFSKLLSPAVPKYSVITDDKNEVGSFTKSAQEAASDNQEVHEIENVKRRNNTLEIPVVVNFSTFYLPDTSLLNSKNYEATNGFTVKSVSVEKNERGYTHRVTLKDSPASKLSDETITVTFEKASELSSWVRASNTTDDTNKNLPNFATTSFGLLGIAQGIHDAYKTPNTIYYTFSITLK
jgi:hypothetical protein